MKFNNYKSMIKTLRTITEKLMDIVDNQLLDYNDISQILQLEEVAEEIAIEDTVYEDE